MSRAQRKEKGWSLVVALLGAVLLGPLVWAALPQGPLAAAQEQPLSVLVVASTASTRPGAEVSLSLMARTTSSVARPVALQLALAGPATITAATAPNGTCTTSGSALACQMTISNELPAAVAVALRVAPNASGTLTIPAGQTTVQFAIDVVGDHERKIFASELGRP